MSRSATAYALVEVLLFACLLGSIFQLTGCDKSLDSVEGPKQGMVLGIACIDMTSLRALAENPALKEELVNVGNCYNLQGSRVKVLKTVLMPSTGKFSQFEAENKGKSLKLWISSSQLA